ncbi:hypothetical protein V8C86DRAFT_2736934 [Haematococcus lacustris]
MPPCPPLLLSGARGERGREAGGRLLVGRLAVGGPEGRAGEGARGSACGVEARRASSSRALCMAAVLVDSAWSSMPLQPVAALHGPSAPPAARRAWGNGPNPSVPCPFALPAATAPTPEAVVTTAPPPGPRLLGAWWWFRWLRCAGRCPEAAAAMAPELPGRSCSSGATAMSGVVPRRNESTNSSCEGVGARLLRMCMRADSGRHWGSNPSASATRASSVSPKSAPPPAVGSPPSEQPSGKVRGGPREGARGGWPPPPPPAP